jgi:hypothetical protein
LQAVGLDDQGSILGRSREGIFFVFAIASDANPALYLVGTEIFPWD